MTTDDERRRVAAALRAESGPSLTVLMCVLGVGGKDVFSRLADLIDPGDMSHACRDTVACDREALRSVASGLRSLGDREVLSAGAAREMADEIMEAIEETGGEES